MDLNQIQIFAAIADNQSFTKAAAQLKMDKSTVSTKLSLLESRIGVRLLNRSTRSVTLTEAGEGYYRYCQQILEVAQEAEQYATTLGDEAVGLLRIASTNTFSRYFIADLIRPFMNENPKVEVELLFEYENVDLIRDQIDVAIRMDIGAAGLKDSSLIARKFLSTQVGLFCSPSYMKKIDAMNTCEKLHELEAIEFSAGLSIERMRQLVENATTPYKIKSRFKVNDIGSCKDAAIAGLGLVMLPQLAVIEELANQLLVPVLEDEVFPMIDIYVVYPSRQFMPAKLKRFLEHLRRC